MFSQPPEATAEQCDPQCSNRNKHIKQISQPPAVFHWCPFLRTKCSNRSLFKVGFAPSSCRDYLYTHHSISKTTLIRQWQFQEVSGCFELGDSEATGCNAMRENGKKHAWQFYRSIQLRGNTCSVLLSMEAHSCQCEKEKKFLIIRNFLKIIPTTWKTMTKYI